MKVLITGAGGFIGSHLTEKCVEMGWDVRAFTHYNSMGNWGWLENSSVKDDVEIVVGDVRDYDSIYEATKGIDLVFHLAALIGIPYSYISPQAYIRTNIEGTYNVIQSARLLGVENILTTSTSETYGSAQFVPINELHPAVGQSPYAATKIGADQIALSFHKSFNLPLTVVRPFNTYGPRQSARAIIPTILEKIVAGHSRIELGNLDTTRDLTFVKDTVAGFVTIATTSGFNGQAVNIGSGLEISIGKLASLIGEVCGVDLEVVTEKKRLRPEKSEVERLICDSSKLRNSSNWQPEYDLRRGIKETFEWLKVNLDKYKVNKYSI